MSRVVQRSDVETYVFIIKEIQDDDGVGMHIPDEIFDVLDKYADLMPNELPKVLPLRRVLDHHIELDSRNQPPTEDLYQL